MGLALAVAFTVVVLLSPAVWSASSAQTSGVITSLAKDAKCKVGNTPEAPAYDPANHEVYVPNAGSASVSVVKAPCTVAATIKLPSGSFPFAAAFDPQNNHVYVTDSAANAVYVISGTKVITTLHGFDQPDGLVYDPCQGAMMVTNFEGDNVSEVSNTTLDQVSLPTGMGPDAIDYNPISGVSGTLNVANYYSSSVTIIDACNGATLYTQAVGSNPKGVAYDIEGYCDYVTNFGSGNVTDLATGGSIKGFDEPSSATWSQAKLAVYVTNYGSGGLWAIQGNHIVLKISVAKGIIGSAYDDANGDIYVTDILTGTLYVYST
ncbi:MAG: YncE family protein [Thermoplasmata archaeon]